MTLDPGIDHRREAWLAQIAEDFDARATLQRNGDAAGARELAPFEPRHLYLDHEELQECLAERETLTFTDAADAVSMTAKAVPRFPETADPGRALAKYLRDRLEAGDRILLAAPERRTQQRLAGMMERRSARKAERVEHWTGIADLTSDALGMAALDLSSGFAIPGLAVIAAADLGLQAPAPTATADAGAAAALSPGELRPGDVVVHAEHGVGRLGQLEVPPDRPRAAAPALPGSRRRAPGSGAQGDRGSVPRRRSGPPAAFEP